MHNKEFLMAWLKEIHESIARMVSKKSVDNTPLKQSKISQIEEFHKDYKSMNVKYIDNPSYVLYLLNIICPHEFKRNPASASCDKEILLSQIKEYFISRKIKCINFLKNIWENFANSNSKWEIIELCFTIWFISRKLEPAFKSSDNDQSGEYYDPIESVFTNSDKKIELYKKCIDIVHIVFNNILTVEANNEENGENKENQKAKKPPLCKNLKGVLENKINEMRSSFATTDNMNQELKEQIKDLYLSNRLLKEESRSFKEANEELYRQLQSKEKEYALQRKVNEMDVNKEDYSLVQEQAAKIKELEELYFTLITEKQANIEKIQLLSVRLERLDPSKSTTPLKHKEQIGLYDFDVIQRPPCQDPSSFTGTPLMFSTNKSIKIKEKEKDPVVTFRFDIEMMNKDVQTEGIRTSNKNIQTSIGTNAIEKLQSSHQKLTKVANNFLSTHEMWNQIHLNKKSPRQNTSNTWSKCAYFIGGLILGGITGFFLGIKLRAHNINN